MAANVYGKLFPKILFQLNFFKNEKSKFCPKNLGLFSLNGAGLK